MVWYRIRIAQYNAWLEVVIVLLTTRVHAEEGYGEQHIKK